MLLVKLLLMTVPGQLPCIANETHRSGGSEATRTKLWTVEEPPREALRFLAVSVTHAWLRAGPLRQQAEGDTASH